MSAGELAKLCDEIAKLRAEVAALTKVIGLFYHAGYDDALHIPAAARRPGKPPPTRRRHLKAVQ